MIHKVYCAIEEGMVEALEVFFWELEGSRWIIMQEKIGGTYELQAFYEDLDEAKAAWGVLKAEFSELPEEPSYRVLEDAEWQEAYKEYIKPWVSGDLHWVPVWEKEGYEVPGGEVAVYLDAGMAFGTGAHETTRLCAERLMANREGAENLAGMQVVDAGCGSGILAISAKKLGYGKVRGFDIDGEAIEVSLVNSGFNGVGGEVEFEVAGLAEGLAGEGSDVVLANILAPILKSHVGVLVDSVGEGGVLVLSGILKTECDGVREVFDVEVEKRWGGGQCEVFQMGEWVAIEYRRK